MKTQQFLIVIEKAGRGYSAYSPDLPGCISTGKTRREAETNMHEALEFHIEGMVEDGLSIPKSESSAAYILSELPKRKTSRRMPKPGSSSRKN